MGAAKQNLVVMKFGGTSVGSIEAINETIQIIKDTLAQKADKVVVVVSAMSGVTNRLQDGVDRAASGDGTSHHEIAEALLNQHLQTAKSLLSGEENPDQTAIEDIIDAIQTLLNDYRRFCDSICVLGEATPRARDYTLGLGERMTARIIAAVLRYQGVTSQAVDATEIIVTDATFQNARPLEEETQAKINAVLKPLLKKDIVPIVTGFIGATLEGVSTTLGRGGSDFSASLIGAHLKSDAVWIWTDVDGVMSTDPRVEPDARTIKTLTYREVGELAYFGAKVLQSRSIRPVQEAGIPLWVKNTFNPTNPGTQIIAEDNTTLTDIKAVTIIHNVSLLTIAGKGMLGVPGIAARTFGAVAQTDISILLISQSSSEQSICFMVHDDSANKVISALEAEFSFEMDRRDIENVSVEKDVAIVTVVGEGIRYRPGVAGRVFTATGEQGVNVVAIAQGSSECSISLVVKEAESDKALRAIHTLTLNRNSD